MFETIAVLLIFFILVGFGLIFYGRIQASGFQATQEENFELRQSRQHSLFLFCQNCSALLIILLLMTALTYSRLRHLANLLSKIPILGMSITMTFLVLAALLLSRFIHLSLAGRFMKEPWLETRQSHPLRFLFHFTMQVQDHIILGF